MIDCTNLTFRYPDSPGLALDAINLGIDPGEFVLVAGPSGAGKSTWLRCLNGLIPHFSGGSLSGTVTVAGIDVVKAGPSVLSQHVGFVFQNPEAQAVLDRVEAEIAWALENAAIPSAEMRVRVEEVLDLLELTPMRDRLLTTLSGGERQRVAIACALALRPQVLVLDEPTSQLDPQSAENVLQTLVRLNEDLGLTIILAEHRLDRVLRYVDRVLYFADGRLAIDDDTQTALAQLPDVPPLVELARREDWQPLPLTVKDARTLVRKAKFEPPKLQRDVRAVSAEILNLNTINHYYDQSQTLKNVSLSLHEGEIVALLGRNGSGKSTLLKCIVGLQSAESGTVTLNGKTTAGRSVADICREVAWLPQNPDDLLFAETVRDELLITLNNHELPIDDAAVDALLDTLGLLALADAYPRDLSVGQRQRVALASILVTQPRILLLDEPTRGLDMATKQRFADLLISWRDEGRAILVVTHDVELAALIADRVIVMAQGEIIAEGVSAEILPSSPLFAPQIARLFPTTGHLTLKDVIRE